MLPSETIAISIGNGPSGTSIVLPRSHELVKHLEALIVPPPPPTTTSHSAPYLTRPALPTNKRTATESVQPTLPALSHHLYRHQHTNSPSSVGFHNRPASPYLSDSSHSSTSSRTTNSEDANSNRRRRTAKSAQTNGGKRCQFIDCDKISVSRGLCRGHGGGRRCQHVGCGKGAQSRSDFCWSHGGGQRCEVPNCMRSRKTKRFCVAHLNWEHAPKGTPLPTSEMKPRILVEPTPRTILPRMVATQLPAMRRPALPSLRQVLQIHQCLPAPTRSLAFANYGPIMNSA